MRNKLIALVSAFSLVGGLSLNANMNMDESASDSFVLTTAAIGTALAGAAGVVGTALAGAAATGVVDLAVSGIKKVGSAIGGLLGLSAGAEPAKVDAELAKFVDQTLSEAVEEEIEEGVIAETAGANNLEDDSLSLGEENVDFMVYNHPALADTAEKVAAKFIAKGMPEDKAKRIATRFLLKMQKKFKNAEEAK